MTRWRLDRALLALLALAGALRLFRIGSQSLWIDEVLSVNVARGILHSGSGHAFFNPHGPIFFYALAPLLRLGSGEWLLRLPSAIAGIALVWVMYLLGKEIDGRRLGLMAGFLAAISPFSVWYSQEVRYVGIFIFLAASSTLLAWRWGSRAGNRDLIGYVAVTLLMLLSFVGGIFLVLGQNLFIVLTRPRWPALRNWLLGQVVLGLLFAPWLVHAYGMDRKPSGGGPEGGFSVQGLQTGLSRPTRPIHLGYALFTFGAGFSLGPSNRDLHENLGMEPVWEKRYEVMAASIALGLALLSGLARFTGPLRKAALLAVLCLALPVLGPYALSMVSGVVYNVRYASGAFPAYLLLLSAGVLGCLQRFRITIAVPAAVVAVMGLSLAGNYADPRYFRDDNRGGAGILREMRRPGEPLVVGAEDRALRHYYDGEMERWTKLELGPAGSQPGRVALGPGRLWVASTRRWEEEEFMRFLVRMRSCFPVERDFNLPGFEVLAFRIDGAGGPDSCTLRWKP